MSLGGDLHTNGQRIVLLAPLTLAVDLTASATTPVTGLSGMNYLAVEAIFVRAAGGTSADAYVQTSLDGGVTWIDIMNFHFLVTTASKISAVKKDTALAAVVTPGTSALGSNLILSGLLGDRLRVNLTTVGTYSGASSLALYAVAKG